MRVDQIPQDDGSFYDGHKRSVYAQNPDGSYVQAHSKGWQVETFFTAQALGALREDFDRAVEGVIQGTLSPLGPHMSKAMMTPKLLAEHVGFFTFQVKRHLRPKVFARLSNRVLQRYADALHISVEELKRIPIR